MGVCNELINLCFSISRRCKTNSLEHRSPLPPTTDYHELSQETDAPQTIVGRVHWKFIITATSWYQEAATRLLREFHLNHPNLTEWRWLDDDDDAWCNDVNNVLPSFFCYRTGTTTNITLFSSSSNTTTTIQSTVTYFFSKTCPRTTATTNY